MKSLKYFAVLVLAGLLLGACVEEPGLSDQNKGKTKPAVTLTLNGATDGLIAVTLAADATAAHYGYVVMEGKDNEAPAAYDIVIDEVSGGFDSDVISYADSASSKVYIECDANADYQIFAAAITADGLVGDVSSLNVFVTDETDPGIVYDEENGYVFESEGAVVAIQYSEPVTYVEGKEIVATLYPGYSYDSNEIVSGLTLTVVPGIAGEPVGTATAEVTVEEDVVFLDFGDLVPGTFYTISIPAGAFEDAAGNPAPAYESAFGTPWFYNGIPLIIYEGSLYMGDFIWGYTENAPFALKVPEVTSIEDLSEWYEAVAPTPLLGMDEEAQFVTTIQHVQEVDGVKTESTTTYPMTATEHYAPTDTSVMVRPAGAPKPKDAISITIPAGALTDIYGNTNAETVVGPARYAYTPVYPNEGKYTVTSEKGSTFVMELQALTDDPEGPYIMYGDWFGLFDGYANPILYLTISEEARTLTCDDACVYKDAVDDLWGSGFYYIPGTSNKYYFSIWGGGSDGTLPVVFNYGDDGNICTMSYFEFGITDASSGAYMGVYDCVLDDSPVTPVVEEEEPAPTATAKSVLPSDFAKRSAVRK